MIASERAHRAMLFDPAVHPVGPLCEHEENAPFLRQVVIAKPPIRPNLSTAPHRTLPTSMRPLDSAPITALYPALPIVENNTEIHWLCNFRRHSETSGC